MIGLLVFMVDYCLLLHAAAGIAATSAAMGTPQACSSKAAAAEEHKNSSNAPALNEEAPAALARVPWLGC
jgi:hypothetical protein